VARAGDQYNCAEREALGSMGGREGKERAHV
jgi:hypothetical protein